VWFAVSVGVGGKVELPAEKRGAKSSGHVHDIAAFTTNTTRISLCLHALKEEDSRHGMEIGLDRVRELRDST
jgi:hypothetical protein